MLDTFFSDYQNILFHTARIFSSVFEIVLAYIMANNFYEFRLGKSGMILFRSSFLQE